MWPDVVIRSSPIFSYAIYLSYIWKNICCLELLKIAQSVHSVSHPPKRFQSYLLWATYYIVFDIKPPRWRRRRIVESRRRCNRRLWRRKRQFWLKSPDQSRTSRRRKRSKGKDADKHVINLRLHCTELKVVYNWSHWAIAILFSLCSSFQCNLQCKSKIKFANDWIRFVDLWHWKRPLYQLSHKHCPTIVVSFTRFEHWRQA